MDCHGYFVTEDCFHGSESSFMLPQDVVDIPGTWHLLRFVGIIVLFKVTEAGSLSLTVWRLAACIDQERNKTRTKV